MHRFDPVRRLSELSEACDRIGSNLFELEAHPTVELLRVSELRGETAARWDAASQTIAKLFAGHEALRVVLDNARRLDREIVFAPTRVAEMQNLLDGSSIVVADGPTQLAERSLTSASRVVRRCTPDALIASMSSDFDQVQRVVVDIDRIWGEMFPALREARRREIALGALCEASTVARAELDAARRQLRALSEDVLSDPLSVDRGVLRVIVAAHDRVERDLSAVRNFVEHREEQLDAARQLLAEARRSVDACNESIRTVQTRIVLHTPVEPVSLPPSLDHELDRIVASDDDATSTAAHLGRWRDAVCARRGAADRTRVECQAMLEERDELRARLAAYRAKSAVLGQLESECLSKAHERARSILFTAPTDLADARLAVIEYQHALASFGRPEVDS